MGGGPAPPPPRARARANTHLSSKPNPPLCGVPALATGAGSARLIRSADGWRLTLALALASGRVPRRGAPSMYSCMLCVREVGGLSSWGNCMELAKSSALARVYIAVSPSVCAREVL